MLLIAIAALGVVAGTIVLYGYVKIRPQKLRAEAIACSGNLKMIQGAKVVWMLESRKTEKDTPTQLDLSGAGKMMQSMPRCYGGGVYRIGAVGEPPTCSVHAERE